MKRTAIPLVVAVLAGAADGATVGFWRFESAGAQAPAKAVSEVGGEAMSGAMLTSGSSAAQCAGDGAGAFTYDPGAPKSLPNRSCLYVYDDGAKSGCVSVPFDPGATKLASFTIELLFKPQEVDAPAKPGEKGAAAQRTLNLRAKGRDVLPLVCKSRGGDKSATFQIEISHSQPPHAYDWLQASVTAPGGEPVSLQDNRYNGIAHVRAPAAWRHAALTYDASTSMVKFYIGYRLVASANVDGPLTMDAAPLLIGGRPDGRGFTGYIDEVRLSDVALEPWDFVRASSRELTGVSFRSPPSSKVPADAGCIDVRVCYGAVGDGKTDDTEAIQRAFEENDNRIPIEYDTLYLPAGTYLVSKTCRWTRFMALRGEGSDKTIIKLKDNCQGFDSPANFKSVVACSRVAEETGGKSGDSIDNNIRDLTIDTGKGNAGAIALAFHSNNIGAARNLVLRSGDGKGFAGLGFLRGWPGPSLIKDVKIEGFDYGAKIGYQSCSALGL